MILEIGIIGCGLMGQQHAEGYRAAPDLAAVRVCCDDRADSARDLAQRLGSDVTATTDWQAVLDDPAIAAVSICVPHHLHAPVVQAALDAGKHVLLEKPMALNLAEARTLVAAAERAGKVFMVAQNQRFLPEHTHIKTLLDDGVIGSIFAARVDGNQMLSRIYPPGHWLFSQATAGGGVIRTTAIHKFDLLRYLVGEIRRVSAFMKISGLNPGMDCDDVAAISLEFDNGAIGEAFFTFAAHRVPIPTATGELTVLYGDQGMLHNVGGWQVYSQVDERYSSGLTDLGLPNADYALSFRNEVRHFLECIATGREPLSSGHDNLRTMAVIEAIYESIEQGCAVAVEAE
ncbi:MAG: Gfo/Idh/MocA family oxidoreductase [Anaerolineae bacterium]|nr:Gfo/Idh/MocA family oxidoreductase [Anaerolineae bacterium]